MTRPALALVNHTAQEPNATRPRTLSPSGIAGSHVPTPRPTRLDQLIARGIAETVRDEGTQSFADAHGLELLELSKDLLGYTPKQQQARFGQGNQQRLFAGLLTYQQYFAPDAHWELVGHDPKTATLTWRCHTIELPLVTDTITRTSRLATAAVRPADDPTEHEPCSRVTRWCDLIDPHSSLLQFPGEDHVFPWCVADDPIRMRNLAFPHGIPFATPGPDTTATDNVLAGRWAK